jgi:hypothetical protein
MSGVSVRAWQGEPNDFGDGLRALAASDSYEVGGETFLVPTREDYRRALAAVGIPRSGVLEDDADLAAAVQAHWHAGGHNACIFAENLSTTRAEAGWDTYVLAGAPEELADAIAAICVERLPIPEVQVVSALMPRLDNAEEIVRLLRRLGSLPDWRVDELDRLPDPDLREVILIGLRAKVELDHWAEVLGFGRFPGQANTRLAPFTELAIRAKEPPRPRRNQRAYIADIEMGLDRIVAYEWWHATKRIRAARLGDVQDRRGKARVTFALEARVWEE